MKYWALGLLAVPVVLVGLLAGCESGLPPEETTDYDANVDPPPTNLVVVPDPDLLADQAKLVRAQAREAETVKGSSGGAAAPGGAAGDPNTAAVREIVTKLIDAAKAGQMGEVVNYLDEADRADLAPTFQALAQVASASAELDAALKEKMDANDIPASLSQALSYGAQPPVLASLARLDPASLSFQEDAAAGEMRVTGGPAPLTFVKSGDTWRLKLSAAEKDVYTAVGVLAQQQITFIQALRDGLRTGAVNQNNIDEKVMSAIQAELQPAMTSLKQAVEKAAGGGLP